MQGIITELSFTFTPLDDKNLEPTHSKKAIPSNLPANSGFKIIKNNTSRIIEICKYLFIKTPSVIPMDTTNGCYMRFYGRD